MWIIAGLSALAGVLVLRFVPAGLFVGRINAAAWRAIAQHPVLLPVVSVTVIQASAQFTLFSYAVVAYRDALGAGPSDVATFLGITGFAGFVGNVFAGRAGDRIGPPTVIFGAITLMFFAFVVWVGLYAAGPGLAGTTLAVLAATLWGLGNFSANSMQQVRLVNLAPALAPVSVALNTSAIYLGQFIGAGIGGLALTHAISAPASRVLPWIGLPIFAVALWVSTACERRAERTA